MTIADVAAVEPVVALDDHTLRWHRGPLPSLVRDEHVRTVSELADELDQNAFDHGTDEICCAIDRA